MSEPLVRIPASHLERAQTPERKHRILEPLRRRMRGLHYSAWTEEAYSYWFGVSSCFMTGGIRRL